MNFKTKEVTLSQDRSAYMQWKDYLQSFFMAFSNIKGLLGNKSLLESTMVLDTQKAEFAISN